MTSKTSRNARLERFSTFFLQRGRQFKYLRRTPVRTVFILLIIAFIVPAATAMPRTYTVLDAKPVVNGDIEIAAGMNPVTGNEISVMAALLPGLNFETDLLQPSLGGRSFGFAWMIGQPDDNTTIGAVVIRERIYSPSRIDLPQLDSDMGCAVFRQTLGSAAHVALMAGWVKMHRNFDSSTIVADSMLTGAILEMNMSMIRVQFTWWFLPGDASASPVNIRIFAGITRSLSLYAGFLPNTYGIDESSAGNDSPVWAGLVMYYR